MAPADVSLSFQDRVCMQSVCWEWSPKCINPQSMSRNGLGERYKDPSLELFRVFFKKNYGVKCSLTIPEDVLQHCLMFLKNVAFYLS